MKKPLRILHLEDNPLDTELLCAHLEEDDIACDLKRVETREDFLRALDENQFDIILSDYSLPSFDGLAAMSLARERRPDLPFLIVTGTLGEEVVIETLKSGATDYVLKQHLSRIVPSVRRALREAQERIERKRAENALRDNLALYTTLIENLQMGVLVESGGENGERRILNVNQTFCDMFGCEDTRQLLGADAARGIESVQTFVSNPEEFARRVEDLVRDGKTVVAEKLAMADGRTLERDYVPIMVDGERLSHLWLYHDLTDRNNLEEQFRQSQKMEAIGRLAGGIAHDFNNLLTVIIGFSNLVLYRLEKDEPGRREIEEIEKAGKRAASLTSQLLAFSRKQVIQPEMVNLNEVIADMDKMLGRIIGEDIELKTHLEPALYAVKADPGQVEQIIMNLAVNARDAMPQGGKLTIATSNVELDEGYAISHAEVKPGRYVMLAISDTGAGMDKQTQSRIFEPFFTTKDLGKGTGLGLSTVYGIIKQSNGHIWVYSEPEHGTIFKIYLPCVEDPSQTSGLRDSGNHSRQGTETILLVEDDDTLRQLAHEILTMNGYTVLDAANGSEAMEICGRDEQQIHLMITDVIMPQVGGVELAERVATQRPDLKILFITGYTDDSILRSGVMDQRIALLQKPFSPDGLARKVRDVLDASSTA